MAVLNSGSGIDGDAVVSADANLHTDSLVGRTSADMVCYNVTFLATQSATLSEEPVGIAAGDKVLLINLQGSGITQTDNVGNWEILDVAGTGPDSISFVAPKNNVYGDNGSDSNIGTAESNQRVIIQRVPQYNTLEVPNGYSLTCSAWNHDRYGVLSVMVKGVLTMNGQIGVSAKGYLGYGGRYGVGGSYGRTGYDGGGYASNPNQGGGGSGAAQGRGGNAGYGTVGGGARAGAEYGSANLNKLFFGSAGGSTYASYGTHTGAPGGGIILVIAGELDCNGSFVSKGQYWETTAVDPDHSGGGAGGSILIKAGLVTMNAGSLDATGSWSTAAVGRIAVYYNTLNDSLSNSNPTAYEDSSLQLPFKLSGTITQPSEIRVYTEDWTFVDSQSLNSGDWEIGNLPSAGPFHVIAVPNSATENMIGYKSITAL